MSISDKPIRLKQFHEAHNVTVYFPDESAESSNVLLVYDPSTPNASIFPDEKKKHLDEVEKEIVKWTNEIASVKTEVVPVEKRWHEAVVGHGGTTLNAYVFITRVVPNESRLIFLAGLSARTQLSRSRSALRLAMPPTRISSLFAALLLMSIAPSSTSSRSSRMPRTTRLLTAM